MWSFSSATQITARTPAGTAGARDVQITNPNGQSATRTGAFTYTATSTTRPSPRSVSPRSGPTCGWDADHRHRQQLRERRHHQDRRRGGHERDVRQLEDAHRPDAGASRRRLPRPGVQPERPVGKHVERFPLRERLDVGRGAHGGRLGRVDERGHRGAVRERDGRHRAHREHVPPLSRGRRRDRPDAHAAGDRQSAADRCARDADVRDERPVRRRSWPWTSRRVRVGRWT